jgi:hypothetical protein
MNYISYISCIILLHVDLYGSLSKMPQTKVDISNCCSLYTNRSKSHLRESVISKFFPGIIPRTPVFKGGRKAEGREGDGKVRREGRLEGGKRGRGKGKEGRKRRKGGEETFGPH